MKDTKINRFLINLIPVKKIRKQMRSELHYYLNGIRVHKNTQKNPLNLKPFADWIKKWTDMKVSNVFEIGANYCYDAAGLQHLFQIPDSNVWAFEAHPDLVDEAKKLYRFNIIHTAVSNRACIVEFKFDPMTFGHGGTSSIRDCNIYHYERTVQVSAIRMDDFLNSNNIQSVDFLKLDVEGCSYEVLEGFGSRLVDVKAIHVEHEHEPIWEGEKLFTDVECLLCENGFTMVYFQRYSFQSDSFWVQSKYITNWKEPNFYD